MKDISPTTLGMIQMWLSGAAFIMMVIYFFTASPFVGVLSGCLCLSYGISGRNNIAEGAQ